MLEHKIHGPTQRHIFKPQRLCARKYLALGGVCVCVCVCVCACTHVRSVLIHSAEFSGEPIKGGAGFPGDALI